MRQHAVFHPAGAARMLTHGGSVTLCARRTCIYVRITISSLRATQDVTGTQAGMPVLQSRDDRGSA